MPNPTTSKSFDLHQHERASPVDVAEDDAEILAEGWRVLQRLKDADNEMKWEPDYGAQAIVALAQDNAQAWAFDNFEFLLRAASENVSLREQVVIEKLDRIAALRARAEAAEARAAAMEAALEEISGHAPVKTPPDYATSSDTGEAFDDGYSRGVWEMGQIADAALRAVADAGFVIVPKEPTPEIITALCNVRTTLSVGGIADSGSIGFPKSAETIYRAAIAAALKETG